MKKFKVLVHDVNKNSPVEYDIMPFIRDTYKFCSENDFWWMMKDNKKPETFEDFKKFVSKLCKYQFWSRCEYEWLMLGWPYGRTDTLEECKNVLDSVIKIDVWDQINMNLDIIVELFYNEINN